MLQNILTQQVLRTSGIEKKKIIIIKTRPLLRLFNPFFPLFLLVASFFFWRYRKMIKKDGGNHSTTSTKDNSTSQLPSL